MEKHPEKILTMIIHMVSIHDYIYIYITITLVKKNLKRGKLLVRKRSQPGCGLRGLRSTSERLTSRAMEQWRAVASDEGKHPTEESMYVIYIYYIYIYIYYIYMYILYILYIYRLNLLTCDSH